MNPTVANIVEQARMGYLAPQEADAALVAVRVHEDDVFLPAEDGLRRELLEVLTYFTLGH